MISNPKRSDQLSAIFISRPCKFPQPVGPRCLQQAVEDAFGHVDKFGSQFNRRNPRVRQLVLEFPENTLAHPDKAPGAGAFLEGDLGDPLQPFVGRGQSYAVGLERLLVLAHDRPFGVLQDLKQIVDAQLLAGDDDRKPPDELRFEPEFYEIAALGGRQVVLCAPAHDSAAGLRNPMRFAPSRLRTMSASPLNAPETMNRMWRVLISDRLTFPLL